MGVILEFFSGGLRVYCKGVFEIFLVVCDKVIDLNGIVVFFDKLLIDYLNFMIEEFVSEVFRILCFVYQEIDNGFCVVSFILINGYTCIGIVGIKDLVRFGVKEFVVICRLVGIIVRMVIGDNINIVKVIVRECGIFIEEGIVIEGFEFRGKSEEELNELILKIQVCLCCYNLFFFMLFL